MLSTFNRRPGAVSKLKDVVLDSWNMVQAKKVMRICTCMLRMYSNVCASRITNMVIGDLIQTKFKRPRSFVLTC